MGFGDAPGARTLGLELLATQSGRLAQAPDNARNARLHNYGSVRTFEFTEWIGLARDQADLARG